MPTPHATRGSVLQGPADSAAKGPRDEGNPASGERDRPSRGQFGVTRGLRSAMDTSAAGSSRTESRSRPDDRLATPLAATARSHLVQHVGAPRLPGTDPPCASGQVQYARCRRPKPLTPSLAAFHPPSSIQDAPKPLLHKAFARGDRLNHPSASCPPSLSRTMPRGAPSRVARSQARDPPMGTRGRAARRQRSSRGLPRKSRARPVSLRRRSSTRL